MGYLLGIFWSSIYLLILCELHNDEALIMQFLGEINPPKAVIMQFLGELNPSRKYNSES